ncbi:MAG TPA: hypothetical protein VKP89_17155 [Burkholderiales bacterium]|nr:hypothetical protein [Burkholderiales bacterium]
MLSRTVFLVVAFLALALPAGVVQARFVFRVGDSVYVDGKEYTWEEWQRIRDQPAQPEAAAEKKSAAAPAKAGEALAARPRAATCETSIYYDEFPPDDEKFQCTEGLGALTRDQLRSQGWRVDFVEKVPPDAGQPASSPRGRPLNKYRLVISR